MEITVSCAECGAEVVADVLNHTKTCSANKPNSMVDELRPPSLVLKFGTPEDQAEWLRKLKSVGRTHD